MKILLANLPWKKGELYGIRAGSRWPFMSRIDAGKKIPGYMPLPFFLAYTAALLEKNKFDVLLIDALAEGYNDKEFLEKATTYKPDLFIAETSTPSIFTDLNWAKTIKNIFPGIKIMLTGSHASTFSEELLRENNFIDYIARGEYEFTTLELIEALSSNGLLDKISGLTLRNNGGIVKNTDRPLHKNLDDLPWPAWHFLPMHNYNDSFADMPSPNVQVIASRGCPFGCIFCNWPTTMYGGTNYRTRNYMDVINEVEFLIKEYQFKAFYFDDDTFNIGNERIIQLCGELKKRNLGVPWAAMARADTSDKETLKAMKDAGIYAIKFGVESGVQEIVNASGKNLDLEKVKESVKTCKELGIKVHLTFTFGLPGETKETIQKTVDFALALEPESVQFSIVTPFPGTKYFSQLSKNGCILTTNWDDYDGANNAVIKTDKLSKEELIYLCSKANQTWLKYRFTRRVLKNPVKYFFKIFTKPGAALKFLNGLIKK